MLLEEIYLRIEVPYELDISNGVKYTDSEDSEALAGYDNRGPLVKYLVFKGKCDICYIIFVPNANFQFIGRGNLVEEFRP